MQESTAIDEVPGVLMCMTVLRSLHIWKDADWMPSMYPELFTSAMNLCGHRQSHGGFSASQVEEIKRAVSIPVITVGRYTEPQFAELMVKEGRL